MFSRRTPDDLGPNPLARARLATGPPAFDLTVSNPTHVGIPYPEMPLPALAGGTGGAYDPDPAGIRSAREAVCRDYARRGIDVDPGRVVLTASSSEAYALLFKILCDPGDSILVPSPSYPLFEHLAAMEGIRTEPYRLVPELGWQPELHVPLPPAARAVVTVHPNNPTGSFVDREAASRIAGACASAGAAIVADEVFADFPLDPAIRVASFAAESRCLTFTLGGLSKSVGLPQAKLSWIVVSGPDREASEALRRLEFASDHYLSVGTPVQRALPELLARGEPVRRAIAERCRGNLETLLDLAGRVPRVDVAVPQGGWSAPLRFPAVADEESLAVTLLREDSVAVHPGYFFDFPSEGWLVVSLLPEPEVFRGGIERVLARIADPVG